MSIQRMPLPQGARIPAEVKAMSAVIAPRRRPSQQRARMTLAAIQDAFVLLLLEKGYEKTTMRDIAGVAGVSIGSLYQYFPGKEAITAMTVRTWGRKLASALSDAIDGATPPRGSRTVMQVVRLFAEALVRTMMEGVASWRVLCALERRVSPQPVRSRSYQHNVDLLRKALTGAVDWPAGLDDGHVAFNAYTIVDSIVRQTLMVRSECPLAEVMVADIVSAIEGYLHAAFGGAARNVNTASLDRAVD